jgi:hypothetical protein
MTCVCAYRSSFAMQFLLRVSPLDHKTRSSSDIVSYHRSLALLVFAPPITWIWPREMAIYPIIHITYYNILDQQRYCILYPIIFWLVVLTILKNISQWEGLSYILWKIKNGPNHPPVLILAQDRSGRIRKISPYLSSSMMGYNNLPIIIQLLLYPIIDYSIPLY